MECPHCGGLEGIAPGDDLACSCIPCRNCGQPIDNGWDPDFCSECADEAGLWADQALDHVTDVVVTGDRL